MASTSRHLDEESVLHILDESEECLISDSSDDSDSECEDDIAVADAAADEEDSDLEEHSLGDGDYNSVFFFWEDMDNYQTQREIFY
jgi:hypothetical protein